MRTPTRPPMRALVAALMLGSIASADDILVGGQLGVIQELDVHTGSFNWRGVCGGPIDSMAIHGDTLYLGDSLGVLYTFDLTTDTLDRSVALTVDAAAMGWDGYNLRIADSSGDVVAIDPFTFGVTGTVTASTDITALSVIDGSLFVGGMTTQAFRTPVFGGPFELVAVCGGQINAMAFTDVYMLLADVNGRVYRYDRETFAYRGDLFVPDTDATAMVVFEDKILVGGSNGRVHRLDPETGVIHDTFQASIDITAMHVIPGAECRVDVTGEGLVDIYDILVFLDMFESGDAEADWNSDTVHDIYDILDYLGAFSSGC